MFLRNVNVAIKTPLMNPVEQVSKKKLDRNILQGVKFPLREWQTLARRQVQAGVTVLMADFEFYS
jgi:hypothetical protein